MAFKKVAVMKVMKAKGVMKGEGSGQLERSLKREVSAKGETVKTERRGRPKGSLGKAKLQKMAKTETRGRPRGRPAKGKVEIIAKREAGMKSVKRKGKVPIVAKGRLSRYMVFNGRRMRTTGGLRKENIGINKRGRYVSLKQMAHGSKMYMTNIKGWNVAFRDARTQLNCKGFVPINGKSLLGQALYVRMKKLQQRHTKTQNKEEVKEEEKVVVVESAAVSETVAV